MNKILSLSGKNSIFTDTTREESDRLIFVKRIPGVITAEEFAKIVVEFAQKGPIVDLKYRRHTGGDKTAFALIYFESDEDGRTAISNLNGRHIEHQGQRRVLSAERAARWSQQVSRTNLYVTNLPGHWTGEDLESVFDKYGLVLQATVLPHPQIEEQNSGAGFVRFSTESDAATALHETDKRAATPGSQYILEVKYAKANITRRRTDTSMCEMRRKESVKQKNIFALAYPPVRVPSNYGAFSNKTTHISSTVKQTESPNFVSSPRPSQDFKKRKATDFINPHPAKRFRSASSFVPSAVSPVAYLPTALSTNQFVQGNQILPIPSQNTPHSYMVLPRFLAAQNQYVLAHGQNNCVSPHPGMIQNGQLARAIKPTQQLMSTSNANVTIATKSSPTSSPNFVSANTKNSPRLVSQQAQPMTSQPSSYVHPIALPTSASTTTNEQNNILLQQPQAQAQLYQTANRLMMAMGQNNLAGGLANYAYSPNGLLTGLASPYAAHSPGVSQGQMQYALNSHVLNAHNAQLLNNACMSPNAGGLDATTASQYISADPTSSFFNSNFVMPTTVSQQEKTTNFY